MEGGEGEPIEVSMEAGRLRWTRNGVTGEAAIQELEPGIFAALLEGRMVRLAMAKSGANGWYDVVVDGRRIPIEVTDPRQAFSETARGARGGKITAPMPGKVVRILVEAGQAVEAGQGVLVVEAMKMQNEMKAPRTGVVQVVQVAEGATVSAGQVLVLIE
jgi:biotin carboxyl carrier protein